ncbi:Chaperone protein HtpG [Thioalkalivibrio nitratireducens DSM 14787]|uniref:Chaperone protein HtpG n=1 Tax=Thioalkalivibrio nitratireducens (strain DSM 14787 / UNIQEM 213 / ALEN2) TaxID=1255043 RepID=L0E1C7_THIND|nr:molecular chaperone HtpG [Thioalkalivibrio nitratireducens]AGA35052.1 Chaperone protein HtpG [Thioalkalivibrio nitratireducens DSM 14787]
MTETQREERRFETEVSQLLHLMIHALYSNREIFLRELISNAADACDKLRFEALAHPDTISQPAELHIDVHFDKDRREIHVIDNGIGMSRDEVVANIGTIARSGTKEFLSSLTGDQQKDALLIGQFGVGFYSSFTVADRVTVETRRADAPEGGAVRWQSDGAGSYTLESCTRAEPGTEVILHLKKDADEFLEAYRLRHIITRYSDHVAFPIRMPKVDDDGKPTDEWETVNRASALWTRAKSEITDDEYREFYKHVAHDFEDPAAWVHSHVEGKQQYTTLFYIPKRAPFDLWDRDRRHGVKLYVKRVFIMDDAEKMLPTYLRFVRGVVDSSDLPLNVSREILQNNRLVDGIRSGSVKKILGLLESIAENEPEKYAEIWTNFGRVLKEGPGEDYANREQIAKLLRFASTHNDDDTQNVSLAEYKSRMKEGQKAIYVVTADSPAGARNSPHLEIFRKHGIEVLLLSDRVDEWLLSHLDSFDGTPIKSVSKGDLDLDDVIGDQDAKTEDDASAADDLGDLPERIAKALGDRVESVRASKRLVESPACIVLGEHEMALYLQELLKQAGQPTFGSKPVLEVNPSHPLVERLKAAEAADFDDLATLLFEQALLTEGGQLEDPAGFVARLNRQLLKSG